MKTLRLHVPVTSGILAFDGRAFYYGDDTDSGDVVIHRLSVSNARLPDLTIPGLRGLHGLSYDPLRHALYAIADDPGQPCDPDYSSGCPAWAMYEVKLPGLSYRKLFQLPDNNGLAHYSYDFTRERFRLLAESSSTLRTVDLHGAERGACKIEQLDDGGDNSPSTFVAVGSGEVYVQLANERTLVRVNAACSVTYRGDHPAYVERAENDAMVCDTVSFKKPAVWLHDGDQSTISAYEVPGGYCPLPTRLAPISAGDTAVGGTSRLCTSLSTPGLTVQIANEEVRFQVNGTSVGAAVTDANGRACFSYAPREPGTKWLRAHAGGTPAYLPSSAEGVINVVPGQGAPPRQGAPVRPEPPRGNEPPAQPATKPNPQPAPGTQPQPQPQPGNQPAPNPAPNPAPAPEAQVQAQVMAQPQVQAQGALVPQVEARPQLADRLAMSRYTALPLGLATVAMGSVGWVLARREQVARA